MTKGWMDVPLSPCFIALIRRFGIHPVAAFGRNRWIRTQRQLKGCSSFPSAVWGRSVVEKAFGTPLVKRATLCVPAVGNCVAGVAKTLRLGCTHSYKIWMDSWLESHRTALIPPTHSHHTQLLVSSHNIPIMNVNSPVHMVTRLLDSMDLNTLRTTLSESTVQQTFSSVSYDVDLETGFFPRQPLRALDGEFALWEQTLVEARNVLKLAVDRGEEALAKAGEGEQWRQRVRSVSDQSRHEW